MKNTHSIIETAQVKQLNEFSRKLIQPRYREKWVEKLVKLSDSEIKFVLESLSNHEVSELFSTISANATGELLLCTEESPNDFDKNHQVKVDTHLVI
ncbi:hypothetical protein [Vibrio metschnikovii]|uniref:hypothetical protein n=1 Tax=Vibrio metschnikovii TaxID=28172 RepID=UPI0020C6DF4C|nr:hypothetical protein [Vibrio metschnikovii]